MTTKDDTVNSKIITAAIIIACISFLSPLAIYLFLPFHPYNDYGNIGDWFGGVVTPLLSLAGFLMVIVVYRLQRKELEAQRDELHFTREEFKIQNTTLKKQNFESTFFRLLNNYNEIIESIVVGRGGSETKGRESFWEMYKFLKSIYVIKSKELNNKLNEDKIINIAYKEFFKNYHTKLGHYFRNIYNIVKFVNFSEIKNKKFYTNILRAQLSTYELALLFYNCLSDYGRKKFKPFIEDYQLVKNLRKDRIFKPEHISLYKNLIFEEDEVE